MARERAEKGLEAEWRDGKEHGTVHDMARERAEEAGEAEYAGRGAARQARPHGTRTGRKPEESEWRDGKLHGITTAASVLEFCKNCVEECVRRRGPGAPGGRYFQGMCRQLVFQQLDAVVADMRQCAYGTPMGITHCLGKQHGILLQMARGAKGQAEVFCPDLSQVPLWAWERLIEEAVLR
jgi:hypothetical protein